METKEGSRAFEQAQLQLDEIQRLADLLEKDPDNDELQDELRDLAVSQEVRSCWQTVGQELEAGMYRLVLCTGGPHVEIQGSLSGAGDPDSAVLYCQDWGTGLQEVSVTEPERELLVWFAELFYWGN